MHPLSGIHSFERSKTLSTAAVCDLQNSVCIPENRLSIVYNKHS